MSKYQFGCTYKDEHDEGSRKVAGFRGPLRHEMVVGSGDDIPEKIYFLNLKNYQDNRTRGIRTLAATTRWTFN